MTATELDDLIARWVSECETSIQLSRTALGGRRLRSSLWSIDIWSASATVGVARGLVADTKSFRAVSRSAALSLDSMLVTSRGTIYENGFFDTLRTGVLSMNHCSIERPHKVAAKAVRLCVEFNLIPDITVQALIASELGRDALESLSAAPLPQFEVFRALHSREVSDLDRG